MTRGEECWNKPEHCHAEEWTRVCREPTSQTHRVALSMS